MEGKVKNVKRVCWEKERKSEHWSSDVHSLRCTVTFAVLYNGDRVGIDEDDLRTHYGRVRITDNLILELNDALHNKKIKYSKDKCGDCRLEGNISDYL